MTPVALISTTRQEVVVEYVTGHGVRWPGQVSTTLVTAALLERRVDVKRVLA